MTAYDEAEDDRFVPDEAARVQYIQTLLKVEGMVADGGPWDLLIERALEDAHAAIERLVRTDFMTLEEVRKAQWEATRFEALAGYINGIVREARDDLDQLAAEERRQNLSFIQGEEEDPDG